MQFIVIDERRPNAPEPDDMFCTEWENKEQAIDRAEYEWYHLTYQEKKRRTIYVLVSVNPDEDAEDHFDGNIIWQDGERSE